MKKSDVETRLNNLAQGFENARLAEPGKKTNFDSMLFDEASELVASGKSVSEVARACGLAGNSLRFQLEKRIKKNVRKIKVVRSKPTKVNFVDRQQRRCVVCFPNGVKIQVCVEALDVEFLSRITK